MSQSGRQPSDPPAPPTVGWSEDESLRIGLKERVLLAGSLLALGAGPAAAGREALGPAEAVRLVTGLGWLSLTAFSAGALVGWHSGRRGWIWGMRVAAAFEVIVAFLMPADWATIRPWLPFLGAGAVVILGAGGLGGWLGSRAGAAT